MSQIVNIFEFTKFRKYLAEYQEKRQELEPAFSRTEFCNQLGLPKTRSYFNDVVQGKAVTKGMLARFIKVLGLKGKEAKYFDAMVRFDQLKNEVAREKALDEMMSLNPNPQIIVDQDGYDLFSNWYNVVIYNLLEVLDVNNDYSELASKIFPSVSEKKIEHSMFLLQKMKLVHQDDRGFWKATRESLTTVQQCKDKMVMQYQKQCMELGRLALESAGKESRDMTTMSFSVSNRGRRMIDSEVERFKNRVRRIVTADKEKPTEVEHLNLHVFSNIKREGV